MVGDTYTIVDMDVWGWARMLTFILGDGACDKFPNVKRLHDEIGARPAAARAGFRRHSYWPLTNFPFSQLPDHRTEPSERYAIPFPWGSPFLNSPKYFLPSKYV